MPTRPRWSRSFGSRRATSRSRMRRHLGCSLFLCLWAACAANASAGVPGVRLRVADAHQRGGLVWQEWTNHAGRDLCVTASGDGPGHYPRPLLVEPGRHWARFVFHTRLKPRRVSVTAWPKVDSSGNPVGDGRALHARVKPRRRGDGRITAWRAFFSLAPPPDYYIDLYAKWRPVCGAGPRHLLRRFQVRAA